MTLQELGTFHKTDKAIHSYLPHYEERFSPLRNKPVRLLEIGIMNGASLQMWKNYFSHGLMYGIDILPEAMITEKRIQCFCGRQESSGFLQEVVKQTGELTIVIDDGGHEGTQHVASFEGLWPHVVPGGWYCVEDASSIFNKCWTQPEQRTILDVIREQWADVLRSQSDIAEITVIGCDTQRPKWGRNNGLIFMRKATLSMEEELEREDLEFLFSEGDRPHV